MGDSDSAQLKIAEARLGRVLRGKWKLDELLGIGGMAAVYSATHRNGKRAAVKVLRAEALVIADLKSRFLREGYLANKVGHPGAVSILDDDTDEDGTVFLVMELLNGETLEQRASKQGSLQWEEVLLVAHQTLDVLVAAHARGIIHRDIKPGNLFIDVESGLKVLDFGIARLHEVQLDKNATGHDKALGTPGFMPPEQARGRSDWVDARSDVFGVGATMFAALTGRHVHEADTVNEQLMLAMTAPAAPISEHCPGLPESVAAIIDRALRFERDDRYPDARAMRDEIAGAYRELAGQPIQEAPRMRVRVRPSRSVHPDAATVAAPDPESTTHPPVSQGSRAPQLRSRGLLFVGLGVVGVLIVGFVAFRREDPPKPEPPALSPRALVQQRESAGPQPSDLPPPPQVSISEPSLGTSASAAPLPKSKPAHKPASMSGKPSSSSAPGVDIFQQRK